MSWEESDMVAEQDEVMSMGGVGDASANSWDSGKSAVKAANDEEMSSSEMGGPRGKRVRTGGRRRTVQKRLGRRRSKIAGGCSPVVARAEEVVVKCYQG